MIVENGRPADVTGRLKKEVRCYDLLDKLGIAYKRADHPVAMTMEACADIDIALGANICKNLLLCNRQCTEFYLLMTPGPKHVKTKQIAAQLGCTRLSFADGKYMEQFLDITPGSLSILGLMNDHDNRVQLLIDPDILQEENFGCHPCINTSSLLMSTRDMLDVLIPALGHEPKMVTIIPEEA